MNSAAGFGQPTAPFINSIREIRRRAKRLLELVTLAPRTVSRILLVRLAKIAQAILGAGAYPGMSDDAQGDFVPLRAVLAVRRTRRGRRRQLPDHADAEPELGAKRGHRPVLCDRDRRQRPGLPICV